jgi:hypothetical protein
MGLEAWIHSRMEVDDEAHPSTQIHGRNKKNFSNHEIKNRAKNTSKNRETTNIVAQGRR